MNKRKMISSICCGVILLIFISPFLWAAEDPGTLVMETIDRGLAVLKDPSLKGTEKAHTRRQQLWEEISPIFNFEEMSKRALGQYWKKRSPEEKKEFVELFTIILKDAYIGKTDTYSGEKIVFVKEKQDEKDYASVQTKIITNTGSVVLVEYRMQSNSGKWKIYDVVIEGVSLVNNYRSQFNNILMKSSYEELVQKIKGKNDKEKT
ncbi:organic solvent tolerance ABC transporter substrate-binding protein [Candidatus Brocadia sapporoensis]|uniref:Organic solvent tolerance ABC transporter substrate-binding protein n=1 Tax=Candidatus Brocadia sapporoensis TaxID=392547 RepID=A0A1V6LZ97_9BACT|nr:ABC transporter substrate-binding protein [Candidatus Brocadia sapporoensis]MDG6005679.1 ABC transporter substrate-binding protein [Candidatus Brocadia sp.]OQD45471.1 organic solvent tolerance ABC transporter substrate-binding protein [Candidatus Brocadia sapporoensis]GJQ22403.1 MAG: toluene tolerance protein [Candidatus Brocadia sapporoensis]